MSSVFDILGLIPTAPLYNPSLKNVELRSKRSKIEGVGGDVTNMSIDMGFFILVPLTYTGYTHRLKTAVEVSLMWI